MTTGKAVYLVIVGLALLGLYHIVVQHGGKLS